MKSIVAVILLIAGISALPQSGPARNPILDGLVDRIQDLSLRIKERGLDPLVINKEIYEGGLPVDGIAQYVLLVEELRGHGLSNIIINDLRMHADNSAIDFDLEIPNIHLSVGFCRLEVVFFGNNYFVDLSGSLDIGRISAKGTVGISAGVHDITATHATTDVSIASITSSISLRSENYDLTERINTLFNTRIPEALVNFRNELNELASIYLVRYINRPSEE